MDNISKRLAELRRKLTFEDFLLIVATMSTDNQVQTVHRFGDGVLRAILRELNGTPARWQRVPMGSLRDLSFEAAYRAHPRRPCTRS